MKKFRSAFVTGILILLPILATADILRWLVRSIDGLVRSYLPTGLIGFDFGGLGLIVAVLIIFLVGLITQNYIGNWLVQGFDRNLRKVALIGSLYGGIRKFLETIINPSSDQFSGVALVEFPRSGVYSIGFRTGKPDGKLTKSVSDKRLVNVFVPCTPNPTSGFYILVPEKELIPLELSVQEAFKILISMGIVTTEENKP